MRVREREASGAGPVPAVIVAYVAERVKGGALGVRSQAACPMVLGTLMRGVLRARF